MINVGDIVTYKEGEYEVIDRYITGDARSDWEVLILKGKLSKAVVHVDWWEVEARN